MPTVLVAGGGLAGLAVAAALGDAGYDIDLYEMRPFLGGRAASYPVPGSPGEIIDNCQHVLLRCCVNLIDLYERLGVSDDITFHREFYFMEPGGRISVLKAGSLPAPLHFTESFLRMKCLGWKDKLGIVLAIRALEREYTTRTDLDQITMLAWLQEKDQTQGAIERFWRQILVSAVNEDLGRMAARYAFQVFKIGFLANEHAYHMGIPNVPLGELYSSQVWERWPNVRIHLRCTVDEMSPSGALVNGEPRAADFYVSCLPFERLADVAPWYPTPALDHSPITGIHLWFDRAVTDLPHAALLDRTIQWMFNKGEGRQIQLVVSASRSLVEMPRAEAIDLALRELVEFFPSVKTARLEKAHVVKEIRATFSAAPGLEAIRPLNVTGYPNFFVAGDWTRSGWPATMEGAVRSGYLAAEALTRAALAPRKFLAGDGVG